VVDFLLASASPRRRDYLREAGYAFALVAVEVEEIPAANEAATDYALRVAAAKAAAGFAHRLNPLRLPVLGADTDVVIDGEVLGKPQDAEHAAALLRRLSGRRHEVISAVVLRHQGGSAEVVTRSQVEFVALSAAEIARYINTGEPFGKAGAYAIQGRFARAVRRVEGSYTGIVGLPMAEVSALLSGLGIYPHD
jgi:septum formation protein